MNNNLDSFFYPKSIAIVGASNNIDKIGGFLFSQIKNKNEIKPLPINIKEETIQGHKAYTNVSSIGEPIDLVIIAVPSNFVIDIVRDVARSGSKNIIIISAGFKEIGSEGKKKEDMLKQIIKDKELNVIGPNCLGILNPEIELNCSFAKDIPQFGNTAMISQSGAVIDAVIDWSFKHKIGFSKIVSMGNMAGLDELDMLEYLKDDEKTKSIVFYMETLEKGKEFSKVLNEISKKKPVIIIKPGNSQEAKNAIGSHTGSLAQDSKLVETLISENNGILVENLNELFNLMIALKGNYQKGNKLTIITNAGGPGVISTDEVSKTKFELYKFDDKQKEMLSFLPDEASKNNPIDILGDGKSDRYSLVMENLEKIKDMDNVMILLTPQIMTDSENIARNIIEQAGKSKKNIFSSFIGNKEIQKAIGAFDNANFPNFQTPGEGIHAMSKLLDYSNFDYDEKIKQYSPNKEKVNQIRHVLRHKKGLLDYELTKEILLTLGIGMPEKKIIEKRRDLENVRLSPSKKYVLKVDSKDIIHKKDVGGIARGVSKENFKEKSNKIFNNVSEVTNDFRVTIEEEHEGVECIVGLKSSGDLGNFIMFGMGGTYVSILNDINFSSCPLSDKRAKKLVEKSRAYKLLKGFRGDEPVDFEHLYEILIRMSYLQQIYPEIKEVDLNPIICNKYGIFLVDVKLIVDHS